MTSSPESTAIPPARTWWPQLRARDRQRTRYRGLDVARALAIIGMVIAHAVATSSWSSGPAVWLGFAHGRSAILFATIAGVSLALLSGGDTPPRGDALVRVRMVILGRAIMLLILAGILSMLPTVITPILGAYALWFILALPTLTWRPRTLVIVAAVLMVTGGLVAEQGSRWLIGWGNPMSDDVNSFIPTQLFASTYPGVVWMGFVLAGLALGRCGLDNPQALKRFLVAGLLLFAGFAAPFVIQAGSLAPLVNATQVDSEDSADSDDGYCLDKDMSEIYACPLKQAEAQYDSMTDADWALYEKLVQEKFGSPDSDAVPPSDELDLMATLWTIAPHSGSPFEALSSGGLALAIVAGLVLLGRLPWSRWVFWPFTGLGSMALTAYMAHVVVLLYAQPEGPDDTTTAGWLILGLVVVCGIWARIFTSGPLEQVTGAVADRLSGRTPAARREVSPAGSPAHSPEPV